MSPYHHDERDDIDIHCWRYGILIPLTATYAGTKTLYLAVARATTTAFCAPYFNVIQAKNNSARVEKQTCV